MENKQEPDQFDELMSTQIKTAVDAVSNRLNELSSEISKLEDSNVSASQIQNPSDEEGIKSLDIADSADQNPLNTMARIYHRDLSNKENVRDILIDSTEVGRDVEVYIVLSEEILDARISAMDVTKKVREIHPEWEITPHVIAKDTDPDLSQIPEYAKSVNSVVRNDIVSESGYAF